MWRKWLVLAAAWVVLSGLSPFTLNNFQLTVSIPTLSITALSVNPNSVPQGTAYSGTLTTTCSAACPNTPSYSLITDATNCPTNNNSVFSLSGATLSMPAQSSSQTACVQVTVAGTANSPRDFPVAVTVAAGSPSIAVNGSSGGVTVGAGASLTVAVNNGAGHPNDWMGICNSGVPAANNQCDGAPAGYSWDYLNCTQTQPAVGVTSATCTLTAPNANGNYVANFFNQNYTTVYASAPFTVSTNIGGTGCSDPSTLVGLPSGWTCDPSLSDDFNGTGAEDPNKWQRQSWPVSCSGATINNDFTTASGFQSGGAYHITISSTDGHTYTWGTNLSLRSAWGSRAGFGFPPNYYIEYRVRLVNSGIGGAGVESTFVSFGVFPAPPPGTVITDAHQSPAYTMMELDVPEANFITWGKFSVAAGGATTGGGVIAHDPNPIPTNPVDGNWHVLGWMRNGGLFTFFEDGSIYRSNMTGYDPDFATSSDNWGYGPYLLGGCPSGTGTYDLQVDYVHVYHN